MAKRKADHVQIHRIELQKHERELFDTFVTTRSVSNIAQGLGSLASGVGSMLMPFAGVLGTLAVAWVGSKTWDELKEEVLDPAVDRINESVTGGSVQNGPYADWVAHCNIAPGARELIHSMASWIQRATRTYSGDRVDLIMLQVLAPKIQEFASYLQTYDADVAEGRQSATLAELWIEFLPWEDFVQYVQAYYAELPWHQRIGAQIEGLIYGSNA